MLELARDEGVHCHTPGIYVSNTAQSAKNTDGGSAYVVGTVATAREMEAALSLVYENYLKRGYIKEPKACGLFATVYHVLPETTIVVVRSPEKITCTLTRILDSDLFGLPMDTLYREELNTLRCQPRKLMELSALATSEEARGRRLFMHLFRAAYWSGRTAGVNDCCIVVNPRHVAFYKRILQFEDMGPEKYYHKVNAPGVALRLDLGRFEEQLREKSQCSCYFRNLYSFFFQQAWEPVNGFVKNPRFMRVHETLAEARYALTEKTDVLSDATPEQMHYIKSIYTGLGLESVDA